MPLEYKLRATLDAHSSDVRAIACEGENIVTASRDKTAILWIPSENNLNIYVPSVAYHGHNSYVTSVVMIPKCSQYPEGLTVTGSKDSNVLVYERSSMSPMKTLSGHTDTVSALIWKNGLLVSASWDHTAKLWKNFECTGELKGHSGPIWGVEIMPTDTLDYIILTASADKDIKSWRNGELLHTYSGHSDCVRGVVAQNASCFFSCSNDASVKYWELSGDCLATYYGHTSFIYSIARVIGCDYLVTGGEDRTMRIWTESGETIQTQYLPTQTAWAVACLNNGDIVVGSSDYKARIFTSAPERQADDSELATFSQAVSESKVAMQDVGGIKKSELPDKTVLHSPGKKDGQTVMVREDDKVMCYSWSQGNMKWDKVGEVVGGAGGSAGTSGKVLHEGKEYDFVFDVDVDAETILKLPFNRDQDPWVVAQEFIYRHELPQDYLDQVANFIVTNAGVSNVGTGTYQDPFTGGARYVPGSSSTSGASSSKYFPQLTTITYDNMNKEGMLNKLLEFNKKRMEFTDDDIKKMVEQVCTKVSEPSVVSPLESMLQWDIDIVWPALDVLRLALRFENVQIAWLNEHKGEVLVQILLGFLKSPNNSALQLLTFRCLSNLAIHQPGQIQLCKHCNDILVSTTQLCPYANKNIEIAAATLVMNCSVLSYNRTVEDKCQVLSACATLSLSLKDNEAIFRTMVALGTMLHKGDLKAIAESLDLKSILKNISIIKEPLKLAECTKDVLTLL